MGLVAKAFQDIITFSRATSGTYVNSNGYITNSSVLNYLTYSNQFDNAAWTKSNSFVQTNLAAYSQDFDLWSLGAGVSVSANSTIAPDGTLTADRITFTAGGATEFVRRTATLTVGVTYTVSVYAQAATGTPTFVFDIGNSGTTSTAQTPTTSWQRFSFTFTFTGANQWFDLESSGAGTIAFWGAQCVQGSVPGDYRATTSAALPILYTGPSGTLNAMKLCENTATATHSIQQTPTIVSGAVFTFSANVKAGERTWAVIQLHSSIWAYVNLLTGAVGTTSGSPTVSVVPMTNGFWRVSVTSAVVSASASNVVYPAASDGGVTYTGDGSSGIYIAQAQLNDGSSALAYYDTTQYPYNAPRFDYDPVTLAAKGLLIEEARTNYLTRSSDFSNSAWNNASPNLPTVTADAILSPDGTVNADLLTAATGGVSSQARQVAATGTTGNFTGSVFLKVGSATRNRILLIDSTTVFTVIGDFQVAWTAGVASVFSTASGTASIVAAKDGFYRCIVTASAASANAVIGFAVLPDPVAGTGSVYAYGAQVEAGAFATSYIPTVGSQITRAADYTYLNTVSPWYNGQAGTWFFEADTQLGTRYLVVDSSGATKYPAYVHLSSSIGNFDGTNLVLTANAITAGTVYKAATTFGAGAAKSVLNAGTVASGVNNGAFASINGFLLANSTGGSGNINGHLRRVTFYPRVLTNAELQTLTTL